MSKIEWTGKTWNPVVGCSKCSPGCLNCYAERMANRLCWMGKSGYEIATNLETGKWTGHVTCMKSRLEIPLHWKKPCKIFVCSMSDLFHPKVPFEFIDKVRKIAWRCPQHTFQILTKRLKRLLEYSEEKNQGTGTWPKNVWLGVTVCTQAEADKKIPILLQIPAAIRFLSIEPLLEGIDINQNYYDGFWWGDMLHWVIVGCESGPKHRPCNIEWVQSIVEQCKAANVPVFVKQINIDGKVVKMPKAYPQELPERP